MAAEEKDDEEREDVLALELSAAVPAPSRGDGGETGDAEADAGSGPVELEDDRSGGRTAEEIAAERPGRIAGEPVEHEDGEPAEPLWKDGPVWTVRSADPGMRVAQELALAERMEQAVETARGGETSAEWMAGVRTETAGADPEEVIRASAAQAGLEGLYRQTAQAARPAAPALPPERAGRTARAQEPGSAASLAVDELDRAVRRDSRRYDGGMSIF